jgi:hypothetical protein
MILISQALIHWVIYLTITVIDIGRAIESRVLDVY